MDGLILVDKPKGISSFLVVKKIRRFSKTKKVGHAGTLDPMASGLLLVVLGKYTKLSSSLTSQNKTYETVFTLGLSTTTDDLEGEILYKKNPDHIASEDVVSALEKFKGKIQQNPPKFSAIKINGQRAYNMARKGQDFSIPKREVEIFEINILNINLPDIALSIKCSKGTYIRSMARDLGESLGVGAIAKEIRRTESGIYKLSDAISLGEISERNISDILRIM